MDMRPPFFAASASLLGGTALLVAAGCGGSRPPVEPTVVQLASPPPPPAAPLASTPQAPTPAPPPEDPSVAVPAGWCKGGHRFTAGGRGYCLRAEKLSWDEAERRCVGDGGHLAQLTTESEARAVAERLRPRVQPPGDYWIGLARSEQGWLWSNDSRLGFAAWNDGEPNNSGGNEHCAHVYASNNLWNDLACQASLPFLCQLPARPHAALGGFRPYRCPGRSIDVGGRSYCLHEEAAPWDVAEETCQKAGGNLAVLGSEADYQALMGDFGAPLRSWRVWLGMTDRKREGAWEWSTGEPLGYTDWNGGEPNNWANTEHCGEWVAGGWNDLPCGIEQASLCEAP